MTDPRKADKPDCFGLHYDESPCIDCALKDECKKEIKPNPILVIDEDEDLEAAAAAALAAPPPPIPQTAHHPV